MEQYELIAPCHFGMEAVLKREIADLGYEISSVENGKVTFLGDAEAIVGQIFSCGRQKGFFENGIFPCRDI